jgi:hypothetical protein
VEELTIKKLREMGANELAQHAENTINRLRDIGAPNISEGKVIRTILKKVAERKGK